MPAAGFRGAWTWLPGLPDSDYNPNPIMGYLIGTDEAGYGPNLGPLVVSATLWHVPGVANVGNLSRVDLYDLFSPRVTAKVPRYRSVDLDRDELGSPIFQVPIADSKTLYKPRGGLQHLERGVLGSLRTIQAASSPSRWSELWSSLGAHLMPDAVESDAPQPASPLLPISLASLPWYASFDEALPIDAKPMELQDGADSLNAAFAAADIRLLSVRAASVFPEAFNDLLEVYKKKSDLLSKTTLNLIAQMIEGLPHREPVFVGCDKHGGRNRYGPLIQDAFPDTMVQVVAETGPSSTYRLSHRDRVIEMRFQSKGETFLPTALASMVAKYLREMAMRAFNDFWCQRVDGLKPTAGYPVDALRFHAEIRDEQKRLQIGDATLWRRK